jgi:predicted MFS family arabinose efflux permease
MVPGHLRGRAIAVAMIGAPLALSLGIPLGTFLGAAVGWRYAFAVLSALTLVLLGWARWKIPDFPGQAAGRQIAVSRVFGLPGVKPVLGVTLLFVLAHNMLFTYIAPFLALAGMPGRVDLVLFVFGIMSLAGIWITGALIDRWLRRLVLTSIILFGLAAVALGIWSDVPAVIYLGIGGWGLAFGGAATLFQTASANAAGEAADIGQSLIVTVWNIAIAGGGALGGVLLESHGAALLPWTLIALLMPALLVAWRASRHGFPLAGHH